MTRYVLRLKDFAEDEGLVVVGLVFDSIYATATSDDTMHAAFARVQQRAYAELNLRIALKDARGEKLVGPLTGPPACCQQQRILLCLRLWLHRYQ